MSEVVTTVTGISGIKQIVKKELSSDLTTTSTSFVDLLGADIKTRGGKVIILATVSFINNRYVGYDKGTFFTLYRDSTDLLSNHVYLNNQDTDFIQEITLLWVDEPPQGNHTYKIMWKVSAHESNVYASTDPDKYHARIILIEVE